jgi:hypothetical protein
MTAIAREHLDALLDVDEIWSSHASQPGPQRLDITFQCISKFHTPLHIFAHIQRQYNHR